jgi:hypothetical protein
MNELNERNNEELIDDLVNKAMLLNKQHLHFPQKVLPSIHLVQMFMLWEK